MTADEIMEAGRALATEVAALPLEEQVCALNAIRTALHDASPFAAEPVDLVLWVPAGELTANDYNPNTVAPPEMELLHLSITQDGYTQPIVTGVVDGVREIVDGFHRHRVGVERLDVSARVQGYLPVTTIAANRHDRSDRMAATIRHNRARGKHGVTAMGVIVRDLARRNWSDAKIGRELGMEPDEVLRLKQITGLADLFSDSEFSEAWELVEDDA